MAIVLLGITIVIITIAFLVNRYWSPILADQIKQAVKKSSDGLYTIDFSSADFHVLRGSIILNNIVLKPDTTVYNQRKKDHLAPNTLIELSVKRLTLSNTHPITLYFKNKLEIGEIIFKEPILNVSYQLNHTRDTITKDNRTPWQKISKSLRSIHVKNIILDDIKFKYEDYSGNKLKVSQLKELNFNAHELLIDSVTQFDKRRLLYCRDIVTDLNNYTGKTANGLYTFSIKSLKLSTLKSQLTVIGFNLKPVEPVIFFGKSQKDRFSLNMDTIKLNQFDFLSFYKYRSVTASSLLLSNGSITIFSNPNGRKDSTTDRIKTYPNRLLHNLNTSLKIDTINIKGINSGYSEFNLISQKTGVLTFNRMSGRLLNITTNQADLLKNNIATANLQSFFMNRGKLNVQFTFNLTDDDATFSYKGTLGAMNLQSVNPAVMPMAMVKIKSGTIKSFNFDVKGDRSGTKGTVALLYNNLSVTILKPDTTNDRFKRMTFASMYANIFILKHDNPDKPGETPRMFSVRYERPVSASFFKTVWQTLLAGIKPSAGFDKKTENDSKQRMQEVVAKKEERKIKRAERKQRRAERRNT